MTFSNSISNVRLCCFLFFVGENRITIFIPLPCMAHIGQCHLNHTIYRSNNCFTYITKFNSNKPWQLAQKPQSSNMVKDNILSHKLPTEFLTPYMITTIYYRDKYTTLSSRFPTLRWKIAQGVNEEHIGAHMGASEKSGWWSFVINGSVMLVKHVRWYYVSVHRFLDPSAHWRVMRSTPCLADFHFPAKERARYLFSSWVTVALGRVRTTYLRHDRLAYWPLR